MRRAVLIASALILAMGVSAAQAQKLDKNGKCHSADGKFARMEVCKGGPAAGPMHSYKLDPKGMCHDEKGKMAKKGLCGAPH